jgi:hypothetical protein
LSDVSVTTTESLCKIGEVFFSILFMRAALFAFGSAFVDLVVFSGFITSSIFGFG